MIREYSPHTSVLKRLRLWETIILCVKRDCGVELVVTLMNEVHYIRVAVVLTNTENMLFLSCLMFNAAPSSVPGGQQVFESGLDKPVIDTNQQRDLARLPVSFEPPGRLPHPTVKLPVNINDTPSICPIKYAY